MAAQADAAEVTAPARLRATLPTGARLFLILSIALLPLALIGISAALQANRITDTETRARLRLGATESARALAIELVGDMTALRVAIGALDADPADAPNCARLKSVFADRLSQAVRFTIFNQAGQVLCGVPPLPAATLDWRGPPDQVVAGIEPGRALVLGIDAPGKRLRAVATFPVAALADIARPTSFTPAYSARLTVHREELVLESLPDVGALGRLESLTVPVGIDRLSLTMSIRAAPLTAPAIVSMLLPLLMWAAAAGIGWFVVDRLLIRPMRALGGEVAAYRPGTLIAAETVRDAPAQELRELGETFRALSATVVAHEADLADSLTRQTRLTREVHHRVKNNLQIIASLINLHARGAASADAHTAYASIQRRVDALAVVHRHHFAELADHGAVSLRAVIADLAANMRATAPADANLNLSLELASISTTQDVAIAVAFLLTELIEMAMGLGSAGGGAITIALAPITAPADGAGGRAQLRVSAPMFVDSDRLRTLLAERYARVIDGLARQLRSKLEHEPLAGVYEISIATIAPG
ncbi:histidine kinase dimerization/phosphoacceptor domain -containing protein [Sphingomonas sp.]|uniref:sensor histidine kinase n=1 Tax=Sphingomonas sp. TaxID=28214 RepID=UPI001D42C2B7|nr:histidine kinase dimerization/phosphoacceptor domain -containing protein [Sphingomonas sp.]MBX9797064.1 histidine kinase [Sphingomonas sp.]